ncbi:TetR/AcrR family transcriptional regulator [Nocardia asteroides]|uniref:TetR family transcriptional regulator n=1 Tax=Nocardia asteroides NBRC 15531 TaxID=1110697 RepID=U5EIB2_NOCAS|nr:TetR/AcrR family transcriptional regulator [Nocardia asteroides]UGT51364.1 TetR/AcrR family transcriptional regulator [Nocardia asteroides]GAD86088.1 putative TetR family transcriptional regulator [Nocardia asteroides NBRC 15531]SFM28509.1 transcriptional regulator, TetR family [Nocardia asteroides]VEG35749.1 Rut operon repressor [Nocardia asteroides]
MTTDTTVSARGVRGDGRRAHRRHAVVVAARDVFVASGYHGARMAEISARAGISKPVLYDHFTNKLDLYLAVLQQYLDRMVDGVRTAVAADAPPRERLRGAVSVYFDFVDDDPGGHVLVFESPVPSEPSVDWRVRSALRACADLVATELRAAGVADLAAATYAWSLVGTSHLAARHWLDGGRPIPKHDAVEVTAALCWNGLSGWESRPGHR